MTSGGCGDNRMSSEIQAATQVGWSWKRQSFQGKKAYITLYSQLAVIDKIKKQLQSIGGEVYDEFSNSCFGRFLHVHKKERANFSAQLHAILGREIIKDDAQADELWFRIGEKFIRFSKYEFAHVTGLRFGDSDLNPNAHHSLPEDGVYMRRFAGGRRLVLKSLLSRFVRGEFVEPASDALKIAKILFVYYILFGVDERNTSVDKWVWVLVEDADRWESFPWGKYAFQILMHRLHTLPTSQPITIPGEQRFSYHFYGFSLALLVWAYEAIPLFGSTFGGRVMDIDLQRPRFIRWRFHKNLLDIRHFFDRQLDCHKTLEPTAEEEQLLQWQNISEDLRVGIQYVHRESHYRRRTRSRPTTLVRAVTRAACSRPAAPTTPVTADYSGPHTSRPEDTSTVEPIIGRTRKSRRLIGGHNNPTNEAHSSAYNEDSLTAVIQREVGHAERRIMERLDAFEARMQMMIREGIRHAFSSVDSRRDPINGNSDDPNRMGSTAHTKTTSSVSRHVTFAPDPVIVAMSASIPDSTNAHVDNHEVPSVMATTSSEPQRAHIMSQSDLALAVSAERRSVALVWSVESQCLKDNGDCPTYMDSDKLRDGLHEICQIIMHREENVKYLQMLKNKFEESILHMQVAIEKCDRPSSSEVDKNASLTEDMIGIVATLGKVEDDNLSRLLAEYLGPETMSAVVCKTYDGVKALEAYNREGVIDNSFGLQAFATSIGRPLDSRFQIICLEDIRPYPGEFVADDPQKRLALPKPRLLNGETPYGFVGFAVNMITIDKSNLSFVSKNEHGLRETLFYGLFSDLQVYRSRENMLNALPCIRNGAISLDGGIMRRHGVFSFGHHRRDIGVKFPNGSGSSNLHEGCIEIKRKINEIQWKKDRTSEDMRREEVLLDHAKLKYEIKKQEVLDEN